MVHNDHLKRALPCPLSVVHIVMESVNGIHTRLHCLKNKKKKELFSFASQQDGLLVPMENRSNVVVFKPGCATWHVHA